MIECPDGFYSGESATLDENLQQGVEAESHNVLPYCVGSYESRNSAVVKEPQKVGEIDCRPTKVIIPGVGSSAGAYGQCSIEVTVFQS